MPFIEIAGRRIETDAEGFLLSATDWSTEFALWVAAELGMSLTPRHWEVINFCRSDFKVNGQAPGPRRLTKIGGFPTKELYELFPEGPGKFAAKLAGLKKPGICV